MVDDSVWENIRLGAVRRYRAGGAGGGSWRDGHEFITALPDGYRTRVGAYGRLLLGGQRQRIAIARAMRRSRCLLLDEPTVGLDAASSTRVLAPLRRLVADRTSIVVSHNLITVRDANLILLTDHGRIAESGTHAELMHRDGGYASLYRLQQQRGSPVPQRESA